MAYAGWMPLHNQKQSKWALDDECSIVLENTENVKNQFERRLLKVEKFSDPLCVMHSLFWNFKIRSEVLRKTKTNFWSSSLKRKVLVEKTLLNQNWRTLFSMRLFAGRIKCWPVFWRTCPLEERERDRESEREREREIIIESISIT